MIGHEVARALGVRAMFAERQDGVLMLRRGFMLERGERILFLPDQHLGRNTAYKMGVPLDKMIVWDPHEMFGGQTAGQIADAKMILWKGHCSVHERFTTAQIARIRQQHPAVHRAAVFHEHRREAVHQRQQRGTAGGGPGVACRGPRRPHGARGRGPGAAPAVTQGGRSGRLRSAEAGLGAVEGVSSRTVDLPRPSLAAIRATSLFRSLLRNSDSGLWTN